MAKISPQGGRPSSRQKIDDGLLTREQFKAVVLGRAQGRCVFCERPAVDAHHILERKLFSDGGFYADNGAAVCEAHHWACETTEIDVATVRAAAGITTVRVPGGWCPAQTYDKWGNVWREDGRWIPGPLIDDVGMRRALVSGKKWDRRAWDETLPRNVLMIGADAR